MHTQDITLKIYESVDFGPRFFSFLDSLECNNLRCSTFAHHRTPDGVLWDSSIDADGVCMITEHHPTDQLGYVGKLTLRGALSKLDQIDQYIKRYATLNTNWSFS